MQIADYLRDIKDGFDSAYLAVSSKGGVIPADMDSDKLPDAIDTIQTGGTPWDGSWHLVEE